MSFWISLTWLKLPFNIRAICFWNIKFFSHVFFGTFKFHIHKSLFSPCHQVFTVTAPYRALAPETADPSRFGCRQLPVHRAQFEETHSAGPHLCGETRNKMDGSGGLCHMSYVWWCVMYVIYIYILHIYIYMCIWIETCHSPAVNICFKGISTGDLIFFVMFQWDLVTQQASLFCWEVNVFNLPSAMFEWVGLAA